MKNRFIPLPLEELDKPYLKCQRYTEKQAWVDLYCLAAYKDRRYNHKGTDIILKRGELVTSIGFLADKWQWGRTTVMRFLNILEQHQDIKIISLPKRSGTKIEILNYGKCFQEINYKFDYESEQKTISETISGTPNGAKSETRSAIEIQGIAENPGTPNRTENGTPLEHLTEHLNGQKVEHVPPSNNKGLRKSLEHLNGKKVEQKVEHINNKYINNNSVCVIEPPQEFLKLFTREQYNELVNKHTKEYTDRVIREMLDYEERMQTKIANPMSLFKSWNPKKKNNQNQKQTPSQRKPGQNKFNNFEQRSYDMNELERKLLGV